MPEVTHVEAHLQDAAGNLFAGGVQVRWTSEVDASLPAIYANYAATVAKANPFAVAAGVSTVSFYSPAGRYKLELFVDGAWIALRRDFPVGTAQELNRSDISNAVSQALTEPVQITAPTAIIAPGTKVLAIVKVNPTTTGLTLPTVAAQALAPLYIFDRSSGFTSTSRHLITLTPTAGQTIMGETSWSIQSNIAFRAASMLIPSVNLNGWLLQ